ncbi:MAG TPA: hypothetical protein VMW42_05150 [Desulfatiglandales bacterium]|nr:hypothetical protein [Desulfatiglandales bacterium]
MKGRGIHLLAKLISKEGKPKLAYGLLWMLLAGIIAGAGFNLALGSVVWNTEGILGGMLAGLLMHIVS